MPLLQVRDCPQDVVDALRLVAAHERRSVAQETVVLLRQALGDEEAATARRRAALAWIRERPQVSYPPELDPVKLIREDRER